MNFLSTFSFANPFWLLAIPAAAAVLVYVYRRRGTGSRIVVATTLLLKLLPKEANSRSSFFPPPRFFLELLICILLALVLAGLETEQKARNVAMLIDTSFHTLARADGRRNFDLIIEQARNNISSLAPETSVSLYASAPGPATVATRLQPAAAIERLETLEPVPASGSLQVAAEYISQKREYETLHIYSDAAPAKDYQPIRSLYYFPIERPAPLNNFAIRSVAWQPGTEQQAVAALRVSVASFSNQDEQITLSAHCVQDGRLSEESVSRVSVRVVAGTTAEEMLPAIPTSADACLVTLSGTSAQFADALEEDNAMWVVARSSSESILLVSPFTPERLQLDAIDTYTFTHQLPEQFLTADQSAASRGAIIFHRSVTPAPVKENALYIAPERALPFLNSHRESDAQVTAWNRGHPLVRYANLSAITLPEANSFDPSVDLAPVISLSKGAVLLAGEYQSYRTVVAGFEMLPFAGKESPTLSILLLNTLKWITETAAGANALTPFQPVPGDQELQYTYFDTGSTHSPATPVARPEQTGLLVAGQADTARYRSVQYFDSQESDLRMPQLFTRPDFSSTESEQQQGNTGWWLLTATLILLLLDLLISLVASLRRAG